MAKWTNYETVKIRVLGDGGTVEVFVPELVGGWTPGGEKVAYQTPGMLTRRLTIRNGEVVDNRVAPWGRWEGAVDRVA